MRKHLILLAIGLGFGVASVALYGMGLGLQFSVFCMPIIVVYMVSEHLRLQDEIDALHDDVSALNEGLMLTQQRLLEVVAATKRDFESMDESFSDGLHEVVKLIADDKYGPAD